jgi:hypothetical protein
MARFTTKKIPLPPMFRHAGQRGLGRSSLRLLSLVFVLTALGCTPALGPVGLTPDFWDSRASTIGVALGKPPRFRALSLPTSMAAEARTASWSSHLRSLGDEALKKAKRMFRVRLTQYGFKATEVESYIHRQVLSDFDRPNSEAQYEVKDFRPYKAKLGVDRLLFVEFQVVGTLHDGPPLAEAPPIAQCELSGTLIDLSTNIVLWSSRKASTKPAAIWDEPPTYPTLTELLSDTVHGAEQDLVQDFFATASGPPLPVISDFAQGAFPRGFSGFTFGATRAASQQACIDAGQSWESPGKAGYFVCSAALGQSDLAGPVHLRFCDDKLCSIEVVARLSEGTDMMKPYKEAKAKLESQHGPASSRESQIPSKCFDDVAPCIRSGTAFATAQWIWPEGDASITVRKLDDGPGMRLRYESLSGVLTRPAAPTMTRLPYPDGAPVPGARAERGRLQRAVRHRHRNRAHESGAMSRLPAPAQGLGLSFAEAVGGQDQPSSVPLDETNRRPDRAILRTPR